MNFFFFTFFPMTRHHTFSSPRDKSLYLGTIECCDDPRGFRRCPQLGFLSVENLNQGFVTSFLSVVFLAVGQNCVDSLVITVLP